MSYGGGWKELGNWEGLRGTRKGLRGDREG